MECRYKFAFVDIMAVALGNKFMLAVTSSGVVFSCGNNDYGQLGLSPASGLVEQRALPVAIDLNNAIMVSAGSLHAACVNRNGSVYM